MNVELNSFWLLFTLASVSACAVSADSGVKLVKTENACVEVLVDGELFTSYHYGLGLHKPIFYPIYSPGGSMVNRGYPLRNDVPGEEHDHWHHESLSFTYGNVNGEDFWAKTGMQHGDPETVSGMIVHTGITNLENVGGVGYLTATADWVEDDGNVVLKQLGEFAFRAGANHRIIDLSYKLTAQDSPVTFGDTKEGMFGLRVNPALREDQSGQYLNAHGGEREKEIWGKRSPWVALSGKIEDESMVVAIFNHPESVNAPTYWHARGYGLFAANPFGKTDFEPGSEPLNFRVEPGGSAEFGYRVLIQSGEMSAEELETEYNNYLEDYP